MTVLQDLDTIVFRDEDLTLPSDEGVSFSDRLERGFNEVEVLAGILGGLLCISDDFKERSLYESQFFCYERQFELGNQPPLKCILIVQTSGQQIYQILLALLVMYVGIVLLETIHLVNLAVAQVFNVVEELEICVIAKDLDLLFHPLEVVALVFKGFNDGEQFLIVCHIACLFQLHLAAVERHCPTCHPIVLSQFGCYCEV